MSEKIVLGALLAALFFSTSASAQGTCRAADITSDGFVGLPDFAALSVCFGQPVTAPVPSGDYVGTVPFTPANLLRLEQDCRDTFGGTAHWCTTLEISRIPDVLALPSGDDVATIVRPTPPLAGGGTRDDWVTGKDWAECPDPSVGATAMTMFWAVSRSTFVWEGFGSGCADQFPTAERHLACCAEPAP